MVALNVIKRVHVSATQEGVEATTRALDALTAAQGRLAVASQKTDAALSRPIPAENIQRRLSAADRRYNPDIRVEQRVIADFRLYSQALEQGAISAEHFAEKAREMAASLPAAQRAAAEAAREQVLAQRAAADAAAEFAREQAVVDRALEATNKRLAESARVHAEYAARVAGPQVRGDTAESIEQRFGIGRGAASARDSAGAFTAAAAAAAQEEAENLAAVSNALKEQQAEYDRLTPVLNTHLEKIDALGQAQRRHAAEVAAINRLHETGRTTDQQRLAMLDAEHVKLQNIIRDHQGLRGFTIGQRAQLGYQLNDIISGLAMGQGVMTILTQQGGQVYQAVADTPGGATAGIKQLGRAAMDWLTPGRAMIGGLAAAGVAAGVAYKSFLDGQKALEASLNGLGRGTNATVGQLNQIAEAAAASGGASRSAAREMAGAYAATGRIGVDLFDELIRVQKDYAATTRQELPAATKELAAAIADPARGAEILQSKLGLLDRAQMEFVRSQSAMGNRAGAAKVLLDALSGAVVDHRSQMTLLGRVYESVTNAVSNFFDTVGKGASTIIDASALENQERSARRVLAFYETLGLGGTESAAAARAQLASVQAQQLAERNAAAREAEEQATRRAAAEVVELTRAYDSESTALRKQIEDHAQLERALNNERITAEMTAAELMAAAERRNQLGASNAAQQQDRALGGSGPAQNLRGVLSEQALSGLSDYEKGLQEIIDRYREMNQGLDAHGRAVQTNTRAMLIAIESYNNALRQRNNLIVEGYEREAARAGIANPLQRRIEERLDPLRDPNRRPTALPTRSTAAPAATAPAGPGDMFDAAFSREGFPNPAMDPSTRGMGDGRFSLGREMRTRGIGVSTEELERTRNTLQQVAEATNGVTEAERENWEQRTRAATTLEAENTTRVQRNELIRASMDALKLEEQSIGKAGAALEALRMEKQLNDQVTAAGLQLNKEMTEEIKRQSQAYAEEKQKVEVLRLEEELRFERSQAFRSSSEQEIASRLRPLGLGMDSTQAQFMRTTEQIREMRDIGSEAFKGLISDLRTGTSMAESFSNALGRISERLQDKVLNSVFDALFNAVAGGLGSPVGLLSSGASGAPNTLPYGGQRATGGSVYPGSWYDVHEGEKFVPRVPGTIIPKHMLNDNSPGGGVNVGGIHINVESKSTGDPAMDEQAAQSMSRNIRREVEGAVESVMQKHMRAGGMLRQAR